MLAVPWSREGAYIGYRVALAPHLDVWMQGDRFGIVRAWRKTNAGEYQVRVELDHSKRLVNVSEDDVTYLGHESYVRSDGLTVPMSTDPYGV